jgi:hypothetical protein
MDRDEPSIQNSPPGQQIDNHAPVQGQNIGTSQRIEQHFHAPATALASTMPLAPIWTVPLLRNPHFTGRSDLLAQLEKRLAPPSHENGQRSPRRAALTQPQAIMGLGGIGKT